MTRTQPSLEELPLLPAALIEKLLLPIPLVLFVLIQLALFVIVHELLEFMVIVLDPPPAVKDNEVGDTVNVTAMGIVLNFTFTVVFAVMFCMTAVLFKTGILVDPTYT